jgi:hypothetical protein
MHEREIIVNPQGEVKKVLPPINIPDKNILVTSDKKEIFVDWRRNFDRMKEIAKGWKEVFPYQDSTRVNLNNLAEYPDKPFLINWGADWHIGNVDTRYDDLKKDIGLIENTPNTGIITVGDDIDMGILPKYEVRYMQAFPPYMQAFTVSDLMDELNGRNPREKQLVLAHCIGNHTHTLMEQSGFLFEKFYERSKAAILPGLGEVFLDYGNQNYEIGLAHKFFGTSRLNKTLCCKRLMEFAYPNADIAVVGHSHWKAHEKLNKGGKDHLAVRPGTYRSGTDLFELSRGWGHGELGGSCTLIFPDKLDTEHFDTVEKGVDALQRYINK